MTAAADALMGIFGFKRVESKMKTIEQTRRELFEVWAVANDVSTTRAKQGYMFANGRRVPVDGYILHESEKSWLAFNAALDAVEIELPERDVKGSGSPDSEMGASLEQYEAVAYNFALEDCRAAIESTNFGLKII